MIPIRYAEIASAITRKGIEYHRGRSARGERWGLPEAEASLARTAGSVASAWGAPKGRRSSSRAGLLDCMGIPQLLCAPRQVCALPRQESSEDEGDRPNDVAVRGPHVAFFGDRRCSFE